MKTVPHGLKLLTKRWKEFQAFHHPVRKRPSSTSEWMFDPSEWVETVWTILFWEHGLPFPQICPISLLPNIHPAPRAEGHHPGPRADCLGIDGMSRCTVNVAPHAWLINVWTKVRKRGLLLLEAFGQLDKNKLKLVLTWPGSAQTFFEQLINATTQWLPSTRPFSYSNDIFKEIIPLLKAVHSTLLLRFTSDSVENISEIEVCSCWILNVIVRVKSLDGSTPGSDSLPKSSFDLICLIARSLICPRLNN